MELSQNGKVLRQLFCDYVLGRGTKMWKTFQIVSFFGTINQTLPKVQRQNKEYFLLKLLSDPNFRKMGF